MGRLSDATLHRVVPLTFDRRPFSFLEKRRLVHDAEVSTDSKLFVVVSGNIGTGKTTLTELLTQHFGWEPHYEPAAENPYLVDFYQDMPRWAFPLQVKFLHQRYQDHLEIARKPNTSSIQDRCIYEDANIFARNLREQGLMSERDYRTYRDLYDSLTAHLPAPDLVIYLKKSVPRLQDQIRLRGRDYEKSIPEGYLTNLNRYYEDWVSNYDLGKKLVIETDSLDFKNRPEDFSLVVNGILENLGQSDLYLQEKLKSKIDISRAGSP